MSFDAVEVLENKPILCVLIKKKINFFNLLPVMYLNHLKGQLANS